MSSDNSNQLVSQDWTPWLVKAPRLIQSLGVCIAAAATPRVSQVHLSSSVVRHRDLATNLVEIANQGQNAFLEAYSDLLEIGTKTNTMGRQGGIFDQLNQMFGEPTAERASARLLDRLKSDIDLCNENGRRTAIQFQQWKTDVDKLHRALNSTQSTTSAMFNQTQTLMQNISKEITMQEAVITISQDELSFAKDERYRLQQVHAQKEHRLNSFAGHTISSLAYGLHWGVVGAVVGTGISAYQLSIATEQVAQAEENLARKRQIALEMDLSLKRVCLELEGTECKKRKLEEVMQDILIVLKLLHGLSGDIISLMAYFKQMNNFIKALVQEHGQFEGTSRSISADAEEGMPSSEWDYRQFHESIVEMKRLSITVHSLASLYSVVITDIINPGFERAIEASHGDATGEVTDVVLAAKKDEMDHYLVVAENRCKSKSLEANRTLSLRLKEINENAEIEARRSSKKWNTKKQAFAESAPRRSRSSTSWNPFR